MTTSKLLLLAILLSGVLVQSVRPLSADGAIVPQRVSYSPREATSPPADSVARTRKLRLACYPVGGECTKNADFCTGFCRSGLQTAYCDNP